MSTQPREFPVRDYTAPRYWPTWVGLGLLRVVAALPYRAQLVLGEALGELMYHLVSSRRRVAQINIRLCFPELDARTQERLVRRSFHATGVSVVEFGLSWWGTQKKLKRLCRFEGEDYLRQALALGKGVLLLGAHYTTLEISGRLLAFHTDALQPIYKPAHNRLFNAVMEGARRRQFDDLLLNTDFRTILRSLKRNKVVWYAPDQDFGPERTVFAPFMGVQTATLTMTARLARSSGAPVLPFFSQRLPGAQGYLIRLLPPLQDFPGADELHDAARVNQVIEEQVRLAPEQYLWTHRRFKTRPPGEPPLYPPRRRRKRRSTAA